MPVVCLILLEASAPPLLATHLCNVVHSIADDRFGAVVSGVDRDFVDETDLATGTERVGGTRTTHYGLEDGRLTLIAGYFNPASAALPFVTPQSRLYARNSAIEETALWASLQPQTGILQESMEDLRAAASAEITAFEKRWGKEVNPVTGDLKETAGQMKIGDDIYALPLGNAMVSTLASSPELAKKIMGWGRDQMYFSRTEPRVRSAFLMLTTIPVGGIGCERTFSSAALTLTKLRNNLGDETLKWLVTIREHFKGCESLDDVKLRLNSSSFFSSEFQKQFRFAK